ncbi:MAG: M48 family metalloprotease [Candidatus Heimdallarchaeota archaeon]
MKKSKRFIIFIGFVCSSLLATILLFFLNFFQRLSDILLDWTFIITFLLYLLSIEEFYRWAKNGKRSEMSDIVAIFFFFFLIFFLSKDLMTSIMGAFSIYLWFGIIELKEYPVLNKILIISLVTYNLIFISGIISTYIGDPIVLNTTFAFSFWIILGLGFLLFGRRYLIVWRFLSPEYLTLFLYIIAWLAVVFVNQYTPLNFITYNPINFNNFSLLDFFVNIYFVLIVVNWIIYFVSGYILDKLLGIKRVDNNKLIDLVKKIKEDMKIKSKVKIGFGNYPILNAMAYGSIFDQRIAIIAEDINQIPDDELKGIVAHELAHTKGKHTLILTCITSGDLILRMLLGIPATFYDYTFGNPQIPLITFIFLNILIYILLFIFVRILEGKADLKARTIGYSKELVKALYNIESFYAFGREIGLNTMLLCDEKITKDNQLLDYKATAEYLNLSMIKPSRGALISNLINSHPPSYHRIAALLDTELKPGKEAILPFLCLKKSVQKKFALKFKSARLKFKEIVKQKFEEYFDIKNIPSLMETFGRMEIYKYDLNKNFLFKNKITEENILGKLEKIKFIDDLCDTDQLLIIDLKSQSERTLNSTLHSKIPITINGKYFLEKEIPLILTDIDLDDKTNNKSYVFHDKENRRVFKQINKTKLPNSIDAIKNYIDREVFLEDKGSLRILKCVDVKITDTYDDCMITLLESNENEFPNRVSFKFKEIIIRPRNISLPINKKQLFRRYELDVIDWLVKKQIRTYIFLKKPVNNLEIGYIQEYTGKIGKYNKKLNSNGKNDNDFLIVNNIFGKKVEIPFKSLELLRFDYETGLIQKKSEKSLVTKLGYKILNKFKPEKIFYLNKI